MENIAVHMRISGVTITDDDVNSRRTAAASLATKWVKERNVSTILSKAADVADALGSDGSSSSALGDEVQKAIQKKAPSFLCEERPLEVGVCAGMAIVSILSSNPGAGGWTTQDVYAAAIWSALAYQPALEAERRETLRREVLDAAVTWATTAAEKARERSSVPDPSAVEIVIGENNAVTNNFQEVIGRTVEALRRNSALDREELDFLWWAQLGRSRLLHRQLSAIVEPTRIVSAGIEGARMLRRLPCEIHRELVLRTLEQDPKLDLAEILTTIGDDRGPLSTPFIESSVVKYPVVFPFLYALITGETNKPGATVKRHVSEWGARALLEAGLARMMSEGTGKL